MNYSAETNPDPSGRGASPVPTIEQLYIVVHSACRDAAYTAYPGLWVADCDNILQQLARTLPQYAGELTAADFELWATAFVTGEARRYQIGYAMLAEHERLISWAVHRALRSTAQDLAVCENGVVNEVRDLIFTKSAELSRPGRAKISTRLTALAKRHVFGYYVRNRKRRLELIQQNPELVAASGCETLSEMEIAELCAIESESGQSHALN